jgi:hypothetical protein
MQSLIVTDVKRGAKHNNNMFMKIRTNEKQEAGKVGWLVLWLLGIPIPILLILFLLRGCT